MAFDRHAYPMSTMTVIVLAVICAFGGTVVYAQNSKTPPKLILQITVDQLRGGHCHIKWFGGTIAR